MQKYNVNNLDEIASIASAASTVMTYLFPNATSSIIQLQNSYTPMGLSANNSTFVKSVRLGHDIGQRIVMSAQHDELANEYHVHLPKGPCTWTGINPVTPMAGYWMTYILKSGAEIQHVAMHDSVISTWYTKYTYWTARPFQRIANFTTVIPTPNHPSYTSGASAISAAASDVLSDLFPRGAFYFTSQALQASMSRLWAGIHSKESIDNGFNVGRQIGRRIVEDMHAGFHPLICCANSTQLIR